MDAVGNAFNFHPREESFSSTKLQEFSINHAERQRKKEEKQEKNFSEWIEMAEPWLAQKFYVLATENELASFC